MLYGSYLRRWAKVTEVVACDPELVYLGLMDKDSDVLALARLRRAINDTPITAVAHFRRTDGRIVTLEDVRPDSIGPSAANPGCIAVEYNDDLDRVTHLPFIESWEIDYR